MKKYDLFATTGNSITYRCRSIISIFNYIPEVLGDLNKCRIVALNIDIILVRQARGTIIKDLLMLYATRHQFASINEISI